MSSLFVRVKQKQYGPFSPAELKNLVATGKFSANDLVYHEDEDQWVEATKIEQLKGLFQKPIEQERSKKVMAIGGGKGGVGKTVLTASMGIGLATLGQEVVMVDADLGGANLHTCMGILEPKYTFYHYYTLQRNNLQDILLETPIEHLKLISGACGTLGLANPRYSQKLRLIKELKGINADYILLDLGAGSSYNVIDFFMAADEGIVVTSPEPMAIQESFGFIKVCLLRKLRHTFRDHPEVSALLEKENIMQPGRMTSTVEDILSEVEKIDSKAAQQFEEILTAFQPKLILNMVHEPNEIREGMALQTAVSELLSLDLEFLGYLEFDDSVRRAVKELKPFIIDNPRSKASRSLAKIITVKLLGKSGWHGFREKRKLQKQIGDESEIYPSPDIYEATTICSVRCFYWDDCEYQNGGFPCAIRHLDPIFKR